MAGSLDLPRLMALIAYWQDVPPLHVVVAGALGALKTPAKKTSNHDAEMMAAEIMAMFPGA